MCWQMELLLTDVAAVKANYSPGFENYHICDRCYVTGTEDIIRQIFVSYGSWC